MKQYVILFFFISCFYTANSQNQVEQYREPFSKSYPIRKEQHEEIKKYIDKMLDEQIEVSLNKFQPDYFSIADYEASLYPYREQLRDYFGYPPPKAIKGRISKFEKAGEDKYSDIYRVWIEVIKGVHAYGIYMVPKNLKRKAPLIIAMHGGGGNPEAICGLDTRLPYHNFGYEAIKKGYIVWAPGLTMLSDYSGDDAIPGISRSILDKQLKLFGSSIIGLEIYKIIKSTQTLIEARSEIDLKNVGMTGLSWGGYFTMYTTALCPFIKAAAISGYFRDTRAGLEITKNAGLSDPFGFDHPFKSFGYFQAIGLICPRPCYVQLGEKDELFKIDGARIEAKRTSEFYNKLGIQDKFEFRTHPGGHEFEIGSVFDFFDKYLR